jgi:hypothetical protein
VVTLGLFTLVGQWGFIASGTYYFCSWDIMEPIAYCMTLSNLIAGYAFYCLRNQELALDSIYNTMIDSRRKALYKKQGLDP